MRSSLVFDWVYKNCSKFLCRKKSINHLLFDWFLVGKREKDVSGQVFIGLLCHLNEIYRFNGDGSDFKKISFRFICIRFFSIFATFLIYFDFNFAPFYSIFLSLSLFLNKSKYHSNEKFIGLNWVFSSSFLKMKRWRKWKKEIIVIKFHCLFVANESEWKIKTEIKIKRF